MASMPEARLLTWFASVAASWISCAQGLPSEYSNCMRLNSRTITMKQRNSARTYSTSMSFVRNGQSSGRPPAAT